MTMQNRKYTYQVLDTFSKRNCRESYKDEAGNKF